LGERELHQWSINLCLKDKVAAKEGSINGLRDPKAHPISRRWGKPYSRKPKAGK